METETHGASPLSLSKGGRFPSSANSSGGVRSNLLDSTWPFGKGAGDEKVQVMKRERREGETYRRPSIKGQRTCHRERGSWECLFKQRRESCAEF